MARGDPLPGEDHVTRWIKPKLLGRDDDGNVIVDEAGRPSFVFPEAFELRDDEDGLSLTCLQRFGTNLAQQLPAAAEAVRRTTASQSLQQKSAFAVGNVQAVRDAGAATNNKLRVIEDPIDGNDGHTEVRRYPREMGPLQTILASQVFGERYLYGVLSQTGWQP